MIIPDDVICQMCRRIFCCAECRSKHEFKNHAIVVHKPLNMSKPCNIGDGNLDDEGRSKYSGDNATIYLFCPICAKKPLLLKEAMYCELLEHIKNHHLPLNCQKCSKIYTKIEDFKEFSKCIQPQVLILEDKDVKATLASEPPFLQHNDKAIQITIATQTSPIPPQNVYNNNGSHITPISMVNMQLKAKRIVTHEEFISDSVSSLRNISSISNSSNGRNVENLSNTGKGKVVRSTSTPLQTEIVFTKPKEQTFNVSHAQVSSIYNNETEGSSIPVYNPVVSPSQRSAMELYRHRKGVRSKMVAVTPLRHVMSKSIQKAIAEHGLASSMQEGRNRKKGIESGEQYISEHCPNIAKEMSNFSPLDLRLSPVRRRACSDGHKPMLAQDHKTMSQKGRDILLSSKKTTTESIVITRLHSDNDRICSEKSIFVDGTNFSTSSSLSASGSIYQTCRSVKIITSTEMSGIQLPQNHCSSAEKVVEKLTPADHRSTLNVEMNYLAPITPRARTKGAIIKKNHIVFETPSMEESNLTNEAFFTPEVSPVNSMRERIKSLEGAACKSPIGAQEVQDSASPYRRPSVSELHIESIDGKSDYEDDEAFKTGIELNEEGNKKSQASSIWSLMASVVRLPSFTEAQTNRKPISHSIIKRCASIAGSIVRKKKVVEDENLRSLKRKRTYTADYTSTFILPNQNSDSSTISDGSSKRFQIHGRKPIKRMRINS